MTNQLARDQNAQNNGLQKSDPQSIAVISMTSDDILPSLGQWSQTLGQKVLIGASASVIALGLWPWRETVRAPGVIRPAGENTVVQSALDGTLATVWVRENQEVRQGEALAALDREQLTNERRRLERELRESIAQQQSSLSQSSDLKQQALATESLNRAQISSAARDVDSALATLQYRETELKRYRSLLASGAVQAIVVDEKSAQVELTRNELSKARQALKEQQARSVAELARLRQGSSQTDTQGREVNKMLEETRSRLTEVQRALTNSIIKAPTAGTVISSGMRHAKQVIRAGEVLAQIAPIEGNQLIKVRIPSRDIGNIKTNQEAYLRISGCPYPDFGVLKAHVKSISPDTIRSEGTGTSPGSADFEVVLHPNSNQLKAGSRICLLRHGMSVDAEVVTRRTSILKYLLTRLRLLSNT